MQDYLTLFQGLPTATAVSVLTAPVIPFLSSLATRAPGVATGAVTAGLATGSGLIAEAAAPTPWSWQAGLGTAVLAWAVAALTHSKVLAGTDLETKLYDVGTGDPEDDEQLLASEQEEAQEIIEPSGPVTAGEIAQTPRPVSGLEPEEPPTPTSPTAPPTQPPAQPKHQPKPKP